MQAVTKVYDRKEVLHQLNLKIEHGTIYGLLSINGAGKTTTFKLLAGLLPPTAGEIRFDSQPIAQKSKAFLKDQRIMSINGAIILMARSALASLWDIVM